MGPVWNTVSVFRALSLFAALVAAAAATNGTVSGIVRDARTGLPLGGVTIHAGKQRTDTDVLGRFNLSDIEPGRQWLSAYAEDRAAAGGRYVTVTARRVAR